MLRRHNGLIREMNGRQGQGERREKVKRKQRRYARIGRGMQVDWRLDETQSRDDHRRKRGQVHGQEVWGGGREWTDRLEQRNTAR